MKNLSLLFTLIGLFLTNQCYAQELTSVPTETIRSLSTIKILNNRQQGQKSWLNGVSEDSIRVWSKVLTTPEGFTMYADKQYSITGLERVKVGNRKRKLIYQIATGLVLGTAGYFIADATEGEGDMNVIAGVITPANNNPWRDVLGAGLGVGLGLTIGNFLGEKTIDFTKDRRKATMELRAFVN